MARAATVAARALDATIAPTGRMQAAVALVKAGVMQYMQVALQCRSLCDWSVERRSLREVAAAVAAAVAALVRRARPTCTHRTRTHRIATTRMATNQIATNQMAAIDDSASIGSQRVTGCCSTATIHTATVQPMRVTVLTEGGCSIAHLTMTKPMAMVMLMVQIGVGVPSKRMEQRVTKRWLMVVAAML